jgi:hypothetical protein
MESDQDLNTHKFDAPSLPGQMQTTITLKQVSCGTELNITAKLMTIKTMILCVWLRQMLSLDIFWCVSASPTGSRRLASRQPRYHLRQFLAITPARWVDVIYQEDRLWCRGRSADN